AWSAAQEGDTIRFTQTGTYMQQQWDINKRNITVVADKGVTLTLTGGTGDGVVRPRNGASGTQIGSNDGGVIVFDRINDAGGSVKRFMSRQLFGFEENAEPLVFENVIIRNVDGFIGYEWEGSLTFRDCRIYNVTDTFIGLEADERPNDTTLLFERCHIWNTQADGFRLTRGAAMKVIMQDVIWDHSNGS